MQVRAIRISDKFDYKELQKIWGRVFIYQDPLIVPYKKDTFAVFLRHGIAVFWNCSVADINQIINKISNKGKYEQQMHEEETTTIKIDAKTEKDHITAQEVVLKDLSPARISLVSLVLGRSLLMERFETEISELVEDLDKVIKPFAQTGRSKHSGKYLIKKVGQVMQIEHASVNVMALLERPDLIWENDELDKFYNLLVDEYQLDERYKILDDKLQASHRSVEFILNYIESKRSLYIELTIVFLILIEILIFFYEHFWL